MPLHKTMAAMANPVGQQILELLKNGPMPVGEIAAALKMSPAACSYHLRKMHAADLLYESHHKNYVFYELNLTFVEEAILWLSSLRSEKDEKQDL